ncbi:MAG: hypothetical protein ABL955_02515 [Elusimicrobiota bacterium]
MSFSTANGNSKMKRLTVRIAIVILSMPLVTFTVKAQDKASSPFPQDSGLLESALKDSIKGIPNEMSKLVQTVMASGGDGQYRNGHAQAAGLDRPMPLKGIAISISEGIRRCQIIYEPDETNGNRPVYAYLLRSKKGAHDGVEHYYRLSLDGKMEKAITLKNKIDDQGKVLSEGRSRVVEDIMSPDIKKAFKTEMTFWLKDWLKKQPKLDTKSTAPNAAAPAQAAP